MVVVMISRMSIMTIIVMVIVKTERKKMMKNKNMIGMKLREGWEEKEVSVSGRDIVCKTKQK